MRDGITRLKQVYSMLAMMMLVVLAPLVMGIGVTSTMGLICTFIAIILLVIAVCFIDNELIGGILLAVIAFLFGMTLFVPVMMSGIPMSLVMTALGMTIALFVILTCCVVFTNKDFSSIGGFLFIALLLLIVVGILNIFIGSPLIALLKSYAAVIIFGAFVLYDTDQIMRGNGTIAQGALSLFLDFINLFLNILNILRS